MTSLNHVAIIMDGNGRWAKERNKNRTFGHAAGVKVISKIINIANQENIKNLSLFAFGVDNWKRSKTEVSFLMDLFFKNFNVKTIENIHKKNIKMNWIGLQDNLSSKILKSIRSVEKKTENNTGLTVNIFFNYSGTADLEQAFIAAKNDGFSKGDLKKYLLTKNLPDVDLLIRTSGELRISNFMLYDIAYAEFIFEKTLWPDYNEEIFLKNLKEFQIRNRRFGEEIAKG